MTLKLNHTDAACHMGRRLHSRLVNGGQSVAVLKHLRQCKELRSCAQFGGLYKLGAALGLTAAYGVHKS
jgi:hypothetical protein